LSALLLPLSLEMRRVNLEGPQLAVENVLGELEQLGHCWRSRLPVLRLICRNETRSEDEHAA
jgi:hypothetical protein